MPYSKDSPPDKIKGLPSAAKSIWISAFNAALKEYKDEGKANATAWSAVKKAGYSKSPDGKWVKSKESIKDDMEKKNPGTEPAKEDYGDMAVVAEQPELSHSHPHTHEDGISHEHSHEHESLHDPATEVVHQHCHPDGLQVSSGEPAGESEKTAEKPVQESAKVRTLYISEAADMGDAAVDKASGSIDVTLIKAGWSRNDHYYAPEMLQRTAKVWEGARAYGNHVPSGDKATEEVGRSIWDQVGYYTNPRYENGAVKATLKLVGDETKKNHIIDWAEESIKSGTPLLGLSINALCKTKKGEAEGRKGIIMEDIAVGNSVDIVSRPAAGGQFNQVLASDDGFTADLLKNLEYDEWIEAQPEYVARIKNEMRTARKDELNAEFQAKITESEQKLSEQTTAISEKDSKIQELETEVNRAKQELADRIAESEKRVNEALADKKLVESKLPEKFVESLKPQLLGKTPEEMDALITEEREKFFSVKGDVEVDNPPTQITEADKYRLKSSSISGRLGNDSSKTPLPGENYAQWKNRTGK